MTETDFRAYSVTSAFAEVSVIVFATSDAHAKTLARVSEWLEDESFIDLRVKREPNADFAADTYGAGHLDFSTADQVRLARGLGWWEITSGAEACARCGLCQWELLPESVLDEDGVCAGCRAKEVAT